MGHISAHLHLDVALDGLGVEAHDRLEEEGEKDDGSLAYFVSRVDIAAIEGVLGEQSLQDRPAARELLFLTEASNLNKVLFVLLDFNEQ